MYFDFINNSTVKKNLFNKIEQVSRKHSKLFDTYFLMILNVLVFDPSIALTK